MINCPYKLTGKVRLNLRKCCNKKVFEGRTETGRSVSVESKRSLLRPGPTQRKLVPKKKLRPSMLPATTCQILGRSCRWEGEWTVTFLVYCKWSNRRKHTSDLHRSCVQVLFDLVPFHVSGAFEFSQSWGLVTGLLTRFWQLTWSITRWLQVHISCKKGSGLRSITWDIIDRSSKWNETSLICSIAC